MYSIPHHKSRHLLPINSMLFRSKSSMHVGSISKPDIYTKSDTDAALNEERDDEITALPSAKFLRRQQKAEDLASSSLGVQQSVEMSPEVKKSKSMTGLLGDKKKPSLWGRFVRALKKPFKKEKKAGKGKEPVEERELVIGGPTDFQHLQSGADCLSPADDAESEWETIRS